MDSGTINARYDLYMILLQVRCVCIEGLAQARVVGLPLPEWSICLYFHKQQLQFVRSENTLWFHCVRAQVGKTVFAHGGVLPAHLDYGINRINEETSTWMRGG